MSFIVTYARILINYTTSIGKQSWVKIGRPQDTLKSSRTLTLPYGPGFGFRNPEWRAPRDKRNWDILGARNITYNFVLFGKL